MRDNGVFFLPPQLLVVKHVREALLLDIFPEGLRVIVDSFERDIRCKYFPCEITGFSDVAESETKKKLRYPSPQSGLQMMKSMASE